MRLADRGPAGPARRAQRAGSSCTCAWQPDPRFERVGDDLHHEAHVAFTQAALGATIEVPTLRGSATIEVEPGSANGTVHRMRHEGVDAPARARSRRPLVHLVVDVPGELDEIVGRPAAPAGRSTAARRCASHAPASSPRRGAKK